MNYPPGRPVGFLHSLEDTDGSDDENEDDEQGDQENDDKDAGSSDDDSEG